MHRFPPGLGRNQRAPARRAFDRALPGTIPPRTSRFMMPCCPRVSVRNSPVIADQPAALGCLKVSRNLAARLDGRMFFASRLCGGPELLDHDARRRGSSTSTSTSSIGSFAVAGFPDLRRVQDPAAGPMVSSKPFAAHLFDQHTKLQFAGGPATFSNASVSFEVGHLDRDIPLPPPGGRAFAGSGREVTFSSPSRPASGPFVDPGNVHRERRRIDRDRRQRRRQFRCANRVRDGRFPTSPARRR